MGVNSIRFTGLSSGLDTESLVSALVATQKSKVDTEKQNQALLELKKESWKEMNTKLLSFRENYISKLRLQSTFMKSDVSISKAGIIEMSKDNALLQGTHIIENVKLATATRVRTKEIQGDLEKGKETKLGELGINATTIQVSSNEKNSEGQIITHDINLTENMTIADLEKELKDKLKDVNVSFDTNAKAFFISSKKTGTSSNISITASDAEVLDKLGLGDAGSKTANVISGQNASLTYNDIEVTSESNEVSINGAKIKLISETQPGERVTLVSTANTSETVSFIKEFVSEYNKLIEEMNTLISAPSNKEYKPLTDDEKSQMSEKDIELWNAKVKESILRKDSTLGQITSSMRDILGAVVEDNTFKTLANIGIKTTTWQEKGKLEIDEEKLIAALEQDSEAVMELFTGSGDKDKAEALYSAANPDGNWSALTAAEQQKWLQQTGSTGLATRLYADFTERLKANTSKSSGTFFADLMLDEKIKESITKEGTLLERLTSMEDRYYAKFTAMEKMLSQLNNQSSWLSSQLGGM